jgi:hypothetical protein
MTPNADTPAARARNPLRIPMWTLFAVMLLTPLVAMRFTREVNWTASDFAVFGAMLATVGLAYELVARASGSTAYRAGLGLALGTAFLVVFANLAVGIIRDEGDPANLLFFGVLAIGFVGAAVARFQARGMAVAVLVMAGAQAAVSLTALLLGWDTKGPLIALGFAALWVASAGLFAVAARQPAG